jgi:succinate dehydrogenase / fumarate reductase membrane anchor subunit
MSRQVQGLNTWILQRLSALYLAGFLIYLVYYFIGGGPNNYEEWRVWVTSPVASISILMFIVMVLIHAWVGIRDVIMDYVHILAIRMSLFIVVGFAILVCAIWIVQTLIQAASA